MSPENKHIDNLFRSKLGDYTETPPPAIWDALEERLDNNDRKRKIAPFYWLWYSLAALVVFIGVSIAGWNWNQKHLAKNDDASDKAADQDIKATSQANSLATNTPVNDAQHQTSDAATTKTDEVEVSYTVVHTSTQDHPTEATAKETFTEADEYEVVKQELEHNIAYAESDRTFNANENASNEADQISYGRKAQTADADAPMAAENNEVAVRIIKKVRRKHIAPKSVKTAVAATTQPKAEHKATTTQVAVAIESKSNNPVQHNTNKAIAHTTQPQVPNAPKVAHAQPTVSVAHKEVSKPAPHKPSPIAASAPTLTPKVAQQAPTATSKVVVKQSTVAKVPAQPQTNAPVAPSASVASNVAKTAAPEKALSAVASKPSVAPAAPAVAAHKPTVAHVVPSATHVYAPKSKKASIVERTSTSSMPVASATAVAKVAPSTLPALAAHTPKAAKEAIKAKVQPTANTIAKVATTHTKVKATALPTQPLVASVAEDEAPTDAEKFSNRRKKTMSFRSLLLASAQQQKLLQATNKPLQVAMQLLPIQKVAALPAKSTPPTPPAPADNSKLKFLKGFEIGVKAGFEKGMTTGSANRIVLAPYIARPVSKKLSVMVQPTIKLGHVRSTDVGSANPYHDIDHSKDMRRYDSTLVFVLPNQDTIWRRDFFFSQTHDTIVRQQFVGGNQLSVELPILLKYQLTNKLSVYGGLNMSYGRAMGLKERTTYQATIVRENNQMFAFTGVADPTMEEAMVYNTSALNSQPQPVKPSGQLNFGYMLGVSYDINKKWKVDAAMQQMKVSENMQQGVNLNQSAAAPYFRVTVGFKLFGQ